MVNFGNVINVGIFCCCIRYFSVWVVAVVEEELPHQGQYQQLLLADNNECQKWPLLIYSVFFHYSLVPQQRGIGNVINFDIFCCCILYFSVRVVAVVEDEVPHQGQYRQLLLADNVRLIAIRYTSSEPNFETPSSPTTAGSKGGAS